MNTWWTGQEHGELVQFNNNEPRSPPGREQVGTRKRLEDSAVKQESRHVRIRIVTIPRSENACLVELGLA